MLANDGALNQWLNCLDGFPLAGAEASIRMSGKGLSGSRFLAAYNRDDLGWANFLTICGAMKLSERSLLLYKDAFQEANQVGFGFESQPSQVVYKLYFEFWDRLVREVRSSPDDARPRLLHLGLKWDPQTPEQTITANYTCFPLLSIPGILSRLENIGKTDCVSIRTTRRIIERASPRLRRDSFVYLEAGEEGNPRRSYDVNLYKANCKVHEMLDLLDAARLDYGLPQQSTQTLERASDHLLGHIGGGQGRDGNDYLTVYYEIDRLPGDLQD